MTCWGLERCQKYCELPVRVNSPAAGFFLGERPDKPARTETPVLGTIFSVSGRQWEGLSRICRPRPRRVSLCRRSEAPPSFTFCVCPARGPCPDTYTISHIRQLETKIRTARQIPSPRRTLSTVTAARRTAWQPLCHRRLRTGNWPREKHLADRRNSPHIPIYCILVPCRKADKGATQVDRTGGGDGRGAAAAFTDSGDHGEKGPACLEHLTRRELVERCEVLPVHPILRPIPCAET